MSKQNEQRPNDASTGANDVNPERKGAAPASTLYDVATGLPSRALFLDRLQQAIRRFGNRMGDPFAILFIGLEPVEASDTFSGNGECDDALTRAIGEQLVGCLRPEDSVCCFGDGRFAVLLEGLGLASSGQATVIAERIAKIFARPIMVDDRAVEFQVGVGVAPYGPRITYPNGVLWSAEQSMLVGLGKAGRSAVVLATDRNRATGYDRYRELDENYRVLLSPVLDIQRETVAGYDAVVEDRASQRLFTSGEFEAVMPDRGRLPEPIIWALSRACEAFADRMGKSADGDQLSWLTVEIAGEGLLHEDLPVQIQRILQDTGVPGNRLRIAVLDNALTERKIPVTTLAEDLQSLGVSLVIRNFGHTLLPFRLLQRLPISSVRLPASLIEDLDDGGSGVERLLSAILGMANALDISVVAEGVGSSDQRERLQALGYRWLQGPLIGAPEPTETH